MKNSNTFVAPTRSEIRFQFSIEFPTLSDATRAKMRRAVYTGTLLVVAFLSACYTLDVQLPRLAAILLLLFASCGLIKCFGMMYREFGGYIGIIISTMIK